MDIARLASYIHSYEIRMVNNTCIQISRPNTTTSLYVLVKNPRAIYIYFTKDINILLKEGIHTAD